MTLHPFTWFSVTVRRAVSRVRLEIVAPGGGRRVFAPPRSRAEVLASAAVMLERMLEDVERIEADLPAREQPVSVATRSLIQASLAECQKPGADVARLAADMQRVGEIALAMRARILLSPVDRRPSMMN